MLGIHDLGLFVLAGLLLNVTPGPDMLYIIARSTSQGWRSGAAATLGVSAGCFVHIAAAALGVSALLAASATAFTILRIAGAIYTARLRDVFAQGFLTNALNPKVALFFLAFLPQFIEVDAPAKWMAFIVLGAIFTFNATWWNLFVAWSAARMSQALGSRASMWLQRSIGVFLVYLGVRLALDEAKTS
jgi:threonine/homoserine/homoserine lactone efflux protein